MPIVLSPHDTVRAPDGTRYTIDKRLGEHGMAMAASYRAFDERGKAYLFKVYNQPTEKIDYFHAYVEQQEALIAKLRCLPNSVIPTHDAFCVGGIYHQVVEWMEGKPLWDFLLEIDDNGISLPPEKLKDIVAVNLYNLKEFHSLALVHEDLKPQNIWCLPNPASRLGYDFRLIDFDFSFHADRIPAWGRGPGAGTQNYYSPEHLRNQLPSSASDVFTMAVIIVLVLYQKILASNVLAGRAPSPDEANSQILAAVESGTFADIAALERSKPVGLSDGFIELLQKSFSGAPDRRPSAADLHAALISSGVKKNVLGMRFKGSELVWRLGGSVCFDRRYCRSLRNIIDYRYIPSGGQFDFEVNEDKSKWFLTPKEGTPNSTVHNGVRLNSQVELKAGDVIQIGNLDTRNFPIEFSIHF